MTRWNDYRPEDYLHARLPLFKRRIDAAKAVALDWLRQCSRHYVACSGGKDSTAMLHLVAQVAGGPVDVMFHDSGVEWPGAREAIDRLNEMGLIKELHVVRPSADVLELKRRQASGEISAAQKDKLALFNPINDFVRLKGYRGVALGLRKGESAGRLMNRATRGLAYTRNDGIMVCTPLGDWEWQDIYAYIALHALPLHPIYSAPLNGLEHRGRIRLSWWASTDNHRHGEIWWVKKNFPEIYQRLSAAIPEVGRYA